MNIKNKIINFDELKKLRKKNKSKTIVLAHGTFDFFHLGHLKHLKKSKSFGDILVVSLTSDKFVKKGVGRPIYSDIQRATIIASLEFVDYVVIANSTSGVETIKNLRPNIYSKGAEYKNHSNDFTKKILLEINELKKYSGKELYTNEIVLSSSSLINKYFEETDEKLKNFKSKISKKVNFFDFKDRFTNLEKKKILVIGDAIIDNYIFTSALSKSPKEEIISVKEENSIYYPGGIFATANNVSNFVKSVTLLSIVDKNNFFYKKIKKKINQNLNCNFFKDKNLDLSLKRRYLDVANKKLFQTNQISFENIENKTEKKIINFLKQRSKYFDLVVVNDFGHGVLTNNIIKVLQKYSKKIAINVQTNSANFGYNFFDKYKKCDYLSLDEPEVRYALRDKNNDSKILYKKILTKTKANLVAITYGAKGTKIFSRKGNFEIPALSRNAIDTMGAGDAFFAISSIYSLEDSCPENIGFIGNIAGALKIKNIGHEKFIDKMSFLGYLKSILA